MELQPGEFDAWVRAFVFTQIVEVPIYFVALGRTSLMAGPLKVWQRLAVAFLCSLITHPVVWFVMPRIIDAYADYIPMVISAETFAVAVEAFVLTFAGMTRRALAVSFLTNMTSMSLGFLVRYFFRWI
jgi:hypothetical protein